ncbi:hypothetical protein HAX54_029037 [Datura stramonium]|uniref:Aminotransferase-like plant mobile domain-containing protein n=1 Tax=Datura stramonium TaxID=4076 RepID=A0ABS8V583_DATST|nr:hypothetical protein [Datura stramonium]
MVKFRDYTSPSSKLKYFIIESTENSVQTKLLVHTPLTGWYAGPWPPLRNTLHVTTWTSECKPTIARTSNMWSLQAPHHCYTNIASPLPSLGHRIVRGDIRWEETVVFEGEYYHIPVFWEWAEDTLGRSQEALVAADIYDVVYASLFTYDRNSDILQAFCEAWCPKTNTILISVGELSISLWDLHTLGGFPIRGSFYEEVIPEATELTCVDAKDQRYIPRVCENLFTAFHYLQESKTDNSRVSLSRWIRFWYRKSISASLDEGLKYWRICVLHQSMSHATFPPITPNMKKLFADDYKNWWSKTHENFLDSYFQILVDAAGPIYTKISEVAPQGCSNATPKTGDSSASMVMLYEQCKGKEPQLLIEAQTKQAYDQDNQAGDADLVVLEIPDSVDSPSRTLTSNYVGALLRGGSQESGESVSDPNPIKSSSADKTGKEATFIRLDGVRTRLSSDFQKHPTAAVYVFDGKKVVLNYRKIFISGVWSVIRGKLSESDVDCSFSLKKEVQVIIEEMDGKDVDVFLLMRLVKSFFELASIYDQARLTLHDKDMQAARKELSIEVRERLSNVMFEEHEKIEKVSSIRQSLSEVKEEIEKLCQKEKDLEVFLESTKKEIEEAKLGVSTAEKDFDACNDANLLNDDGLTDLE